MLHDGLNNHIDFNNHIHFVSTALRLQRRLRRRNGWLVCG